ncbi:hypothetical protein [Herpetosiphon llansteffanensis]|uniref:hypothetical protein n=1 Tax=Herpetosiphon llansteffanensis TaxID=2094568 RepID=UPI000D7C82F5|nr:hypothetical protein [Herpetosiphon llansteffanensis]
MNQARINLLSSLKQWSNNPQQLTLISLAQRHDDWRCLISSIIADAVARERGFLVWWFSPKSW